MGRTVGSATADDGKPRSERVTASSPSLWARRVLEIACTGVALMGGFVLVGFMLVSVGSILSRAFLGSPLLGDFEITERGSAIAVFTVLPYCHLKGGHVVVDMFVGMMAPAIRRQLAVLSEIAFAVVSGALTWALTVGGYGLYSYNDASMMLQIPTWWMFVPVVASMGLLTLVCVARAVDAAKTGAAA